MNVYITGAYDKYTLNYKGYTDDNGKKTLINGKLSGSKKETEASALGIVLKHALDNDKDVHIYTTFEDIVKLANGEYKPVESRTKDFVRYINKITQSINVSFTAGIPDEQMEIINNLGNNRGNASVQNPFKKQTTTSRAVGWKKRMEDFSVTIRKPNGEVLCNATNFDFGGKLADAVYFADWYEKEGKNPDSFFYGCTVERKNVPLMPKKEPEKEIKKQEKPAPEKREEKEKVPEQLSMF